MLEAALPSLKEGHAQVVRMLSAVSVGGHQHEEGAPFSIHRLSSHVMGVTQPLEDRAVGVRRMIKQKSQETG